MGSVYRARDRQHGRTVAVKFLDETSGTYTARFDLEASILRTLAHAQHPGIVGYVDSGQTHDGERYLAMEWLDGETLERRIARGPLLPDETFLLAGRILSALAAAHAHGVIHRDLKPANIFLVGGDLGEVRLVDFGVARATKDPRLTRQGATVGTTGYMAPEQARGLPDIDGRVDIFAVGCVLVECLTGLPAFTGDNDIAVLAKICFDESLDVAARCPRLPREAAAFVQKLLIRERDKRARDAGVLSHEALALSEGLAHGRLRVRSAEGERRRARTATGEQRVLTMVLATVALDLDTGASAAWTPAELSALAQIAAGGGGELVPMANGAVLVLFSGASSPIDQAVHAARVALALRDLRPGIGQAVVTGRAVFEGALPFGDAIDRGGRLLDLVSAGDIALDESTAGLVVERFEIEEPTTRAPIRPARLGGPRARSSEPRLVCGVRVPFLGRERELAFFTDAVLESVRTPAARAFLVTAPAGVGKSRLGTELAQHLRNALDSVRVLEASAEGGAQAASFRLAASILRAAADIPAGLAGNVVRPRLAIYLRALLGSGSVERAAPFLAELCGVPFPSDASPALAAARGDPRLMADRILGAWLLWLTAELARAPLALLVDDAQDVDAASARLLQSSLRTLIRRPIAVIALGRIGSASGAAPLFGSGPRAFPARTVALEPLDPAAARQLVQHVRPQLNDAQAHRFVDRAAGNPFVLEELLRIDPADGRGEALPDSVLGMVQARLDALPPALRRTLRAVSVFGLRAEVDGVAAVLDEPDTQALRTQLGELTRAELLQVDPEVPGGMRFRQALIRDAAYATLTDLDRQACHRLAAAWLSRTGRDEPGVMADHLERAGQPDAAAAFVAAAATRALVANDVEGVLSLVERGARLGGTAEIQTRLHLAHAQALYRRGEAAAAEAAARAALASARGDDVFHAIAELGLSLGVRQGWDEIEALGRSLTTQRPDETPGSRCAWYAALCRLATFLVACGRYELAEMVNARFDEFAGALDTQTLARTHDLRAEMASHRGELVQAIEALETSYRLSESIGDEVAGVATLLNLSATLMDVGAFAEAEKGFMRALTAAERQGIQMALLVAHINLAQISRHMGRLDDACRIGEEGLKRARKVGDRRAEATAQMYLALVYLDRGVFADAEVSARESVRLFRDLPPRLPGALATLARALLSQGRIDEAMIEARDAHDLLVACRVDDGEALVRLTYAEALAAAGDARLARTTLAAALKRLDEIAAAIRDPERRLGFLERVRENRRTRDLARAWGLV